MLASFASLTPTGRQYDDLAGRLVALHVPVGRCNVVEAVDPVEVRPVDAGLDIADDPLEGSSRYALPLRTTPTRITTTGPLQLAVPVTAGKWGVARLSNGHLDQMTSGV